MRDPYIECPVLETESFIIRIISEQDADDLYECYHSEDAVKFMNDDNCDFGFYIETKEQMAETIKYWIDFYRERAFIRFAIVDIKTNKVVGTMEGFGGEVGVLRLDILSEYEIKVYMTEIFTLAKNTFKEIFGNERLVTKAIEEASARREALVECGWEYIGAYKTYEDYYEYKI